MDASPPSLTRPEQSNSYSYDTPENKKKSVFKGCHSISHIESPKRLFVNAGQLRSLTGAHEVITLQTIHCTLSQYGNKYPEQVRPPGHFHGILNEKDNLVGQLFHGAKASGTVFNPVGSPDKSVKAGHKSSAGFSTLWTEREYKILENNKTIVDDPKQHQFNGKQLCVYFSLSKMADTGTGEIGLKLLPSDYFSQAIARRGSPTETAVTIFLQ